MRRFFKPGVLFLVSETGRQASEKESAGLSESGFFSSIQDNRPRLLPRDVPELIRVAH